VASAAAAAAAAAPLFYHCLFSAETCSSSTSARQFSHSRRLLRPPNHSIVPQVPNIPITWSSLSDRDDRSHDDIILYSVISQSAAGPHPRSIRYLQV